MKLLKYQLLAGFLTVVLVWSGIGFSQQKLSDKFEPLRPLIGKTWRGTFTSSTEEKPMEDVSRWERTLNGQAIRVMHSINDGVYGGETIIYWDKEKQDLVYYYFTTAGFYTNGTMTIKDSTFISHEYVTGNEEGITEVKSTSKLLPDGRLHATSQYLKKGEWVKGHEVYYKEEPTAEVVFK